jgi:Zn-dependent M28 family amino/carboxypeptidase
MCRFTEVYPPPDKRREQYKKRIPTTISKKTEEKIQVNKAIQGIIDNVSTNQIKEKLNQLSSFHTRHSKSTIINEVAEWLLNEFKSLGYSNAFYHTFDTNIDNKKYQLKNVICEKKGENNKMIIICAHYDCIMEDLHDSTSRAPGANDNASGVSAILEMARVLINEKLFYTIQFILFSGEEQGLHGSVQYSKFIKENNLQLFRLINLDMIGYPQLNPGIVIIERDNNSDPIHNRVSENDNLSIETGEIMARMAEYNNLEFDLDSIYNSDYEPFEARGYVVIGAYDGSAENINPHYHNSSDTPSLIDWKYLTLVTKMVLATVITLGKENHST